MFKEKLPNKWKFCKEEENKMKQKVRTKYTLVMLSLVTVCYFDHNNHRKKILDPLQGKIKDPTLCM